MASWRQPSAALGIGGVTQIGGPVIPPPMVGDEARVAGNVKRKPGWRKPMMGGRAGPPTRSVIGKPAPGMGGVIGSIPAMAPQYPMY